MEPPPPPPPPPQPSPSRFSWREGTFLFLAVSLVVAIVAGLVWSFLSNRGARTLPSPYPRPTAVPTASSGRSCGPVQQAPPFASDPGDRAHARVPLSSYPSTPPASGPHDPAPLPAGSYREPPPVGRTLHSLEHGAVVIWFEPSLASSETLDELRAFMGPSGPGRGRHIIIAPYSYPAEGEAGRLPQGAELAMVAWHRIEYCARLDADALRIAASFVAVFRCPAGCNPAAYRGEAPEPGVSIG